MTEDKVLELARGEAAAIVLKALRGLLEELRVEIEKERLPFGIGRRVDELLARVRNRYGA